MIFVPAAVRRRKERTKIGNSTARICLTTFRPLRLRRCLEPTCSPMRRGRLAPREWQCRRPAASVQIVAAHAFTQHQRPHRAS